jgi:hypothetical protein
MNKKLIGLALLLTLAASLGACNSGENAPADGGATPGGAPAESSPSPSPS